MHVFAICSHFSLFLSNCNTLCFCLMPVRPPKILAPKNTLPQDPLTAALEHEVQRDLCGFRRHDLFCKELNVPDAVRSRMGMVRSR